MLMNSVFCRPVLRILRPMESVLKLATLRKTLLGQAGLAMRWDLPLQSGEVPQLPGSQISAGPAMQSSPQARH